MQLIKYEQAKRALAEYKTVDEVKDFRDKAVAVEAYAKQAQDFDLERDAAIARVRAERRCGQLLTDMEKLSGRPKKGSKQTTLSDLNISKDQSSKWQKLAEVPDNEFEKAVADSLDGKELVNTTKILKNGKPVEERERIDPTCLWWWGRLLDMEKTGMNKSLPEILDGMTDAMRQDSERIIPKLEEWLGERN